MNILTVEHHINFLT